MRNHYRYDRSIDSIKFRIYTPKNKVMEGMITNTDSENKDSDLGAGSVNKVFAEPAWEPELDSHTHLKSWVCLQSQYWGGKEKMSGACLLTSFSKLVSFGLVKDPVTEKQYEEI